MGQIGKAFLFILSIFGFTFFISLQKIYAQQKKVTDFLLSYYAQEGQHSAVTGGEGTETLRDHSLDILIVRPLDSLTSVSAKGHVNYYTSASTDKIDTNVSSASKEDIRTAFDLQVDRRKNQNWSYYTKLGGSMESDYLSFSVGAGFSYRPKSESYAFNFGYSHYRDTWQIILVEELRPSPVSYFQTNKRRAYNWTIGYFQVANRKTTFSLNSGFSFQKGLLSTPFHRFYFKDQLLPTVERFPGERWSIPVAFSLNRYMTDYLILKSYYRYYFDSFEIRGHTAELTAILKADNWWSFKSNIRFHRQQGAYFFAPMGVLEVGPEFRTSDFDLSTFDAWQFGVGIFYSPPEKIFKQFSTLGLTFNMYNRSDGLSSRVISSQFSF